MRLKPGRPNNFEPVERPGAAQAVFDLRKALGMTQQDFAVLAVKCAMGSVARWETFDPPKGETLLRFHQIALTNGLPDHAETFKLAFLEEVDSLLEKYGCIEARA